MLRSDQNANHIKAGIFSLAVHLLLLLGLMISFNWKAAHPTMQVAEVELWDKLSENSKPKLLEIKPESKPMIKEEEPEPKPVEERQVESEHSVDIALENKKKAIEDMRKKQAELERIKQESREDELSDKKAVEKKQKDELKRIQEESLAEDHAMKSQQVHAEKQVANANIVGEFTDKIKNKIRAKVNKTVCSEGEPELKFEIGLLPTGELSGHPKLLKSSGIVACDDAVERAIIASEPLPLPNDPDLFSQFRNLKLKFRPNE